VAGEKLHIIDIEGMRKHICRPLSIHGDCARIYEQAASILLQGELPAGWEWVPCSKNAVVAATTESPIVFYKEFLPRNNFEKIKAIIRGNRSKRARKQAGILHKADLPTPKILCWGRGQKNVFLISEGFDGVGFFQYLKINLLPPLNKEKIRKKRLLLKEAGSLIGKMHSKGIVHGDMRQNNLLVIEVENGFQFSLIDNESNRKWWFIPRSQILKNLVQFSIFSDNLLSKTDLMRLYNAYAALYPRFSGIGKRFFLRNVFRRSQRRILLIKLKKAFKETCQPLKNKNFHGECEQNSIVARQFESQIDPAQWFLQAKTVLKNDNNVSVKILPGSGGDIIAKRFAAQNSLYHPSVWSKMKRASRQWKMSHIFIALEIPVARPLGFVLEGKSTSYYYSENLANAKDLVRLSREIGDFPDWLEKEKIISRFARYLAILHNNNYCHGDTKWANILANASSGKFWVIDLDGAFHVKFTLGHKVRKDLSRFIFDMIKYGLPKRFLNEFMTEYCNIRMLNKERVQKKIEPLINKIRERHKRKKLLLR
jgi:tRNA A-37 threonylcarbamoyl transferase component Bud32